MKELKIFGLKLPIFAIISVVVLAAMYMGVLSKDLAGGIAVMLVLGIIFNEIGERIPIWNDYVGGGLVLAFIGTAFLVQYNLIPADYVELMDKVTSKPMGMLNFFIIALITGSILGLNRKLMIKSFSGYIPAIIGGLIGAGLFGVVAGLFFGVSPADTILKYVLPVMGGGNGAGAVPLSQIYERVTGDAAANYYGFAIAILTIANIFAIIAGGVLKAVGEKKPSWTGDKNSLIRSDEEIVVEKETFKIGIKDYAGAVLLGLAFYQAGRILSEFWDAYILPSIPIHQFAFMIILVALANGLGVIPGNLRMAAKDVQTFFTKNLVLVIMVGVGVSTDLNELWAAITLGNVVIALAIVIGCIFGSAIVGWLVGFYPVDTAVTAGLCMANRGGSGDLAVLGAADRMGLMSYAQLSSRLGGGMVLVIASILFGFFF
ncbi:2-hydroxycarboxylate transporter family protein [Aerococcaceae bacterium zg-ZUI334]|uniref:2-hydroxycarboxylate transporter family protein n=1 Tax=Aerococcaceae TaxID=186827 RepID=UPI0013BA162F|nr:MULTISPECIES: 2-hydroxycarboxylate transporter family protein [unclassified Facklamia]MBR7927931.1 2-hydroxycarboxylate transporter family protein [Aerococcaceae bacterium zg-ZUI334]MBS4462401.1 2-hydroxycarboxylate transporter family protein [Aerococcaceae bacterium zg-B36]QQD66078.1 2-hydroxycarboxylate transporter family protein [Aerococcaceae bacterium zg-252]NEW64913.1 damage-inducible protein CinA [Facklamia sp. 252]NEW68235.1 damage-inducible protein CinA [Facklamia sp. 253]